MNKSGDMSISERPITIDDLKRLRSVAGLPSDPPAILIRADQEVSRPDLDRVIHALGAADMWSIKVAVPKAKPMHNHTSGIRQSADGLPKPSM
jgi:biopolymer transport protein ExbD